MCAENEIALLAPGKNADKGAERNVLPGGGALSTVAIGRRVVPCFERRVVRFAGASGDKNHTDIGPKRFTFFGREGWRRAPLSADYIWQRDKTCAQGVRAGVGAIEFVENCQLRNMNDEITGKSHFRVRARWKVFIFHTPK